MKQRIFALLLVVALLVTAAVVAVSASDATSAGKDYNAVYAAAVKMTEDGVFAEANRDAETGAVTAECPYCDVEATWLPLESGTATTDLTGNQHYYLPDTISGRTTHYSIGSDNAATSLNFCLHLNGKNVTSSARVFYVTKYCTMNIMGDGVITGGYTSSSANRGATMDCIGELNLCGGTYKRTKAQAVIGLRGSASDTYGRGLNVYNGTEIDGGGSSYSASTVYVANYNTLNIAGGTIKNGNATTGGNIYATGAKTKVKITGGTVTGGTGASGGGNIYMVTSAQLEMTGGAVTDGVATGGLSRGGNIYVGGGAVVTIKGGEIANGVSEATNSQYGGGNIMAYYGSETSYGTLNIEGGTISGGRSTTTGSSILAMPGCVMTVSGGNIVDGGVCANFTVSGAPVIDVVDVSNGHMITVGALETGASIGINANAATVFTTEFADSAAAEAAIQYFHTEREITVEGNALKVGSYTCPHCGKTEAELEAASTPWTKWDPDNDWAKGDVAPGHYYLSETKSGKQYYIGYSFFDDPNGNLAYESQTVDGARVQGALQEGKYGAVDVVLDMRGYSITNSGRAMYTYEGSDLTLLDTTGGSQLKGAVNSSGGVMYLGDGLNNHENDGKIKIYGVDVIDTRTATRAYNGGAIVCSSGVTLEIYDATVSANHAASGGAIYATRSTIKIDHSVINGGTATGTGGVIYAAYGTLEITNNSELTSLVSSGNGGVLYTSSQVTITDSVLTGNTNTTGGGGVIYATGEDVKINVSGSKLYGGKVTGNGGIFYTTSGTIVVDDCTLYGSDAGARVPVDSGGLGGVACINRGSMTIKNGSTVYDGTSSYTRFSAPGIYYIGEGTLTLDGSDVESVTAYDADFNLILKNKVTCDELWLRGGSTNGVDAEALTDDSAIGVKMDPGVFTKDLNDPSAYVGYFTSLVENAEVVVDGSALAIAYPTIKAECAHCDGAEATWQAWTGAALPEGDHYYLYADANLTGQVNIGVSGLTSSEGAQEIIIDLHGKNITSTSRAFQVRGYNSLVLMDTTGKSEVKADGYANSGKGADGGVIIVAENAKLNVMSGKYTLNSNLIQNGGIICAYENTDVTVGNATLDASLYDQTKYEGSVIYTQGMLTLDGLRLTSHPDGDIPFAVYVASEKDVYAGELLLKGNTVINNDGIGGNMLIMPYAKMTVDASFTGEVKVSLGGNHVPDPYYGSALSYDTCNGDFEGTLILDDWLYYNHIYGAPKIEHKYNEETKDTKLYVQGDVMLLVNKATKAVQLFESVDAMLAVYNENPGTYYIKVGTAEVEIELPAGEHIIDINGYPVTVTCAEGTANVYGLDSSNATTLNSRDGALVAGEGVTVKGADKIKQDPAIDGKTYYMLHDPKTSTYTYHYVTLKLKSVSLRTSQVGIYYTAEIEADSRFRYAVEEYGVVVRLDSAPTVDFATEAQTGWSRFGGPMVSGNVYGTMVKGIMKTAEQAEGRTAEDNQANGERQIYAAAYITLNETYGGETVLSETCNYSLYTMLEALDADTKLLATEIKDADGNVVCTYGDKLNEFYTAWKNFGMNEWAFNNIKEVVEETTPEA